MLETEIKNLTAAIQLLTDAVNKNQSIIQPKTEAVDTTLAVEADAPSVDTLQQRCLELTGFDKNNSAKIKAIIASYGGRLVKDIPADKLGDFAAKLEELA